MLPPCYSHILTDDRSLANPKNRWSCIREEGIGHSASALSLAESGENCNCCPITRRKDTVDEWKSHFSTLMLESQENMLKVFLPCLCKHEDVVDVDRDKPVQHVMKDVVHPGLEHSGSIG